MRLIDADALLERLVQCAKNRKAKVEATNDYETHEYHLGKMSGYVNATRIVDAAPTIEPKKGKWIENEGRRGWHCSACGEDDLYAFVWNCDKGEHEQQDNYCPKCGARMDKDGE